MAPPPSPSEHARRLTDADGAGFTSALLDLPPPDRAALAWAVKDVCIEAWTSEPQRTQRCAALLGGLRQRGDAPEIDAAAAWCNGIAQLTLGQMETAIASLDRAERQLLAVGQAQRAAQSQITKVLALSMLGRYDEALLCGERILAPLIDSGDEVSAGKVELNLGSMLLLRDRYDRAAGFYRRAAVRFARAGDALHSIMADIGVAGALAGQFDFDEALRLYERAAMRTRARGLSTLQGVIDTNRGRLELQRGRFEPALRSLEAALREAERDGMPQHVAEAQRDMADVYLALNLLPEAIALYDQTIESCRALDAPIEQAWAKVQRATALVRRGDVRLAASGLEEARELFAAADNPVGSALADLRTATLGLATGDSYAALQRADAAAAALRAAGVEGWSLEADVAAADILATLGRLGAAHERYLQVLAQVQDLPEVQAACHTGLGLLLRRQGDRDGALAAFEQAVRCAEAQRAALPGDEFRTAYGADKQRPYDALIELAIEDDDAQAPLRLLRALERARAPALRTSLARRDHTGAIDPARRERLHWLHGQWQQAIAEADLERARQLQARSHQLEREWLEQQRREQAARGASAAAAAGAAGHELTDRLDADALCARMPEDTALVVFGLVGDRLAVCVLTREGLQRVDASAAGLGERIEQLRFQIDSLRFGAPALRAHGAQMAARARTHLQALDTMVWQPLAPLLAGRERVVIVPQRGLHYLPFCALHDGRRSLIERHEISLAPSVSLWLGEQTGVAPPMQPPRHVAAFGVGGAALPHVAAEIDAVAQAFRGQPGGSATTRKDDAATQAALREALAGADVLHLACHGQFRADSPYFSALQLADGPLTVRDAASLPLQAGLVTLSACETGVSRVAPGDELLGLLRGFMLAGAPRVLATQWTVDDASTAALMGHFYRSVLAGERPAAALRAAQRSLAAEQPHPYHWAPFTLHERG